MINIELVQYEVKERLAYVTLNRPAKLNAINLQMFNELVSAFDRYEGDPGAWVAILSGKGRSFCAGHDQTEQEAMFAFQVFLFVPLSATPPTYWLHSTPCNRTMIVAAETLAFWNHGIPE